MDFNLGDLDRETSPTDKLKMLKLALKLFELQQFCITQHMGDWQDLESCCREYLIMIGRYLRFGRTEDLKVRD